MNGRIDDLTMDPSGFVVLSDHVPQIVQEIRYHSSPQESLQETNQTQTETKSTETKPTEPKPTESKTTEPKATAPAPTETKHTHNWGAWKQTKAPTCSAKGSEARSCTGCSKTQTRDLNQLSHNWSNWKQTKAPTCSYSFINTPDEDNHSGYESHGDWVVDAPAYDVCARCGATK